jgi:hypothetical protein
VYGIEEPIPVSKAGNIQGSFLISSLDHIVGFAVPIAGYYLWGGGTGDPLPVNFSYSGFLWAISIGNIVFEPINPLTQGHLEWLGDTGLNFTMTNITTRAYVDLKIYLLWVIPIWGLRINFDDLNVTALLDFSESYNRYPQLALDLDLKYDNFEWSYFIITWIVKLFLSNEQLINLVENAISGAIDGLNESFRNRQPDSFLVNIMQDLSANIGFSMPFKIDKQNDLIYFGLDGRIYNTTTGEYQNEVAVDLMERFPRAHANQFFIHQSSIEAALRSAKNLFLPISLEDPGFNQLLGIYIPELFEKYGEKGSFKIEVDLSNDFDIKFSLKNGISLANAGIGVTIYGKKSGNRETYEQALTFSMNLDIQKIDLYIQELVVHTNIGEAKISNSFLTSSSIGNITRNNWNQFFESLINFELNEVNINNKEFDIKSLSSYVDLISGQIPNSTVAFSYKEEYLYAGLKFFNDD